MWKIFYWLTWQILLLHLQIFKLQLPLSLPLDSKYVLFSELVAPQFRATKMNKSNLDLVESENVSKSTYKCNKLHSRLRKFRRLFRLCPYIVACKGVNDSKIKVIEMYFSVLLCITCSILGSTCTWIIWKTNDVK